MSDFVLTPKQIEFARACNLPVTEVKEVLFGGAIRSGKSQVAAHILVDWALKWPGLYMACRATYQELDDSTRRIFLYGDGSLPPAIPESIIRGGPKGITARKVILANGSEILFRSLEETEKGKGKIRNITLSGVFVDQLEEFDTEIAQQMYQELVSRCSHPKGPRKIISCANPGPRTHWAYDRFVDPNRRYNRAAYVHVEMRDNEQHLPADYVEWAYAQETENPNFYRRFVIGEWGAFGGKRFPDFDENVHVVPSENFYIDPQWEILEGIDYGSSNPFAVVWVAIDYDGRWWVFDEHYEKEKPLSHHARKIHEIRERHKVNPLFSFIDPSTFNRTRFEYESVAFELQEQGIQLAKAQNERLGGWARIEEMLTEKMHDGLPRLRILDRCENLLRELPSLKYKENSDDIEKEHDHAADALRYALMSRPQIPKHKEPPRNVREERVQTIIDRHDRVRERRVLIY